MHNVVEKKPVYDWALKVDKKLFTDTAFILMGEWLEKREKLTSDYFAGCVSLRYVRKANDLQSMVFSTQTNFGKISWYYFQKLMEFLPPYMPVSRELFKAINKKTRELMPWMRDNLMNAFEDISMDEFVKRAYARMLHFILYSIDHYWKVNSEIKKNYIHFMLDCLNNNCYFLADLMLFKDKLPLTTLEAIRSEGKLYIEDTAKWLAYHEANIAVSKKRQKIIPGSLGFYEDNTGRKALLKEEMLEVAIQKNMSADSFFSDQEKSDFIEEVKRLHKNSRHEISFIFNQLHKYVMANMIHFDSISPELIPKDTIKDYQHVLLYVLHTAMKYSFVSKAMPAYKALIPFYDSEDELLALLMMQYDEDVVEALKKALTPVNQLAISQLCAAVNSVHTTGFWQSAVGSFLQQIDFFNAHEKKAFVDELQKLEKILKKSVSTILSDLDNFIKYDDLAFANFCESVFGQNMQHILLYLLHKGMCQESFPQAATIFEAMVTAGMKDPFGLYKELVAVYSPESITSCLTILAVRNPEMFLNIPQSLQEETNYCSTGAEG